MSEILKPVFLHVSTKDSTVRTVESDSVVGWLYANKQDELAKKFAALSHEAFDEMLERTVKKAIEDETLVSAAKTESAPAPETETVAVPGQAEVPPAL